MKYARLIKVLAGIALVTTLAGGPVLAMGDKHDAKDKKEVLYPNATRKEPKLDLNSEKEQKALNEGMDAANSGDKDKANQILQPIADSSKSKYAQALALQALASAKYNDGDVKGGIDLLKRSLDNGVLPNETYFQLEYELAQFYLADQQYQASLDEVDKWRAEGKRETADSYALQGNAYYRLQKFPEAIAAIKKAQSMTDKPNSNWNQILMASYSESGQSDQAAQLAQQQLSANPNDPDALNNAVSGLIQAQKYPEAIQLMEKARSQGNLKSEKDYVNLAKLHMMKAQSAGDDPADTTAAVQVLQDGMSKGIVMQSSDNYKLMGDAHAIGGETDQALQMYRKAIPDAKDGEAAVAAGSILVTENKFSEAKSLLQQGIDKGVKHKGNAYLMLANANRGLKDKAGAVAAVKMASQDPETADKARTWLKKSGEGE